MKAWMSSNFGKFETELLPIKTKFCIHIIIDKIYFGIVNCCFSQIGKRVTALD